MQPSSRSLVRGLSSLAGLCLMGCMTACGAGNDTAATGSTGSLTPDPVPTALTCPHDSMVLTAGGLFTGSTPAGYNTRRAAVDAWLAHAPPRFSRTYVISSNGRIAWLLRKDGTAETKLRFLRHEGFLVHGYESCT